MKRVQRRRTPGFHLPANTVCINRGTKFGNPFVTGKDGTREEVIQKFKELVESKAEVDLRFWLEPLHGKDVACFCSLDEPCHGDYLIELCGRLGI